MWLPIPPPTQPPPTRLLTPCPGPFSLADYYQWSPFPAKTPGTFVNATREWPAEVGLVKVKEALHAKGVPIAYTQLDDWWYQGYAYNVGGVSF